MATRISQFGGLSVLCATSVGWMGGVPGEDSVEVSLREKQGRLAPQRPHFYAARLAASAWRRSRYGARFFTISELAGVLEEVPQAVRGRPWVQNAAAS